MEGFRVSECEVSLHYPLHRFFGVLAHYLVQQGEILVHEVFSPNEAVEVCQHILRAQAFLAQVRSGMWRFNGRAVIGQSTLYRSQYCVEWLVDVDVFLLQMGASVCHWPSFERLVTDCFEVTYITEEIESNSGVVSEDSQRHVLVMEDMLRLFVAINSETARAGMPEDSVLRRRLLHRLSVEEQSHSELIRFVPKPPSEAASRGVGLESARVETLLSEVADYREPDDLRQGEFSLKEKAWLDFDAFNAHFTARERNSALERYQAYCKRQSRGYSWVPVQENWRSYVYPSLAIPRSFPKQLWAESGFVMQWIHQLRKSNHTIAPETLQPLVRLAQLAVENPDNNGSDLNSQFFWPGLAVLADVELEQRHDEIEGFGGSLDVIALQLGKNSPTVADQLRARRGKSLFEPDKSPGDSVREKRLKVAKERRAAMMKEMQRQQRMASMRWNSNEGAEGEPPVPAGEDLNANHSETDSKENVSYYCVLCREDGCPPVTMGQIGFAQKTRVLERARRQSFASVEDIQTLGFAGGKPKLDRRRPGSSLPVSMGIRDSHEGASANQTERLLRAVVEEREQREKPRDEIHLPELVHEPLLSHGCDTEASVVLGFCGHHIHLDCFQEFFSALLMKAVRSQSFEGEALLVPQLGEFLCPVCRRLSNLIIPLHASTADMTSREDRPSHFPEWVNRWALSPRTVGRSLEGVSVSQTVVAAQRMEHAHAAIHRVTQGNDLRRSEGGMEDRIARFWATVISSMAAVEVSLRGDGAQGHGERLVESCRHLLNAARGVVLPLRESGALSLLFFDLWSRYESQQDISMDPFCAFMYLFFSMPLASVTMTDLRWLGRLCLAHAVTFCPRTRAGAKLLAPAIRRIDLVITCFFNVLTDGGCLPICQHAIGDLFSHYFVGTEVLSETTDKISNLTFPFFAERDRPMEELLNGLLDLRSDAVQRPRLLELAPLFQDLIEANDRRNCCYCERPAEVSLLCLVCGCVICGSGRCKSDVPDQLGNGATSLHAEECGAGVAIFLILKQTVVLIVREDRRCVWPSPYLDDHGEEDRRLRRGKPLRLSRARYQRLNNLWATHSFDADSEVLRLSVRVPRNLPDTEDD
eukprot:CAMPEP_0198329614 /NCGR_PEP_ID=MMETSP1450-20131203/16320_1 /TAXON_ID=753684 ORGANISM="Madagascaria erythrocladiodes, Strain CCMP3234" /NCGR_SAMPLE_ID=MMETSP1450 /ASSEMBLY_ACC=CAM_ASM_001115 /LENGTH=1097 /DNA_ID=CAMNT_0044033851 /DNA_START=111 /DNA_END=3404 /DNA_ORIENTATION=+